MQACNYKMIKIIIIIAQLSTDTPFSWSHIYITKLCKPMAPYWATWEKEKERVPNQARLSYMFKLKVTNSLF